MKKSYEKPEVKQVKLATDEAVLQNCKTVIPKGTTSECFLPDGQINPFTIGS